MAVIVEFPGAFTVAGRNEDPQISVDNNYVDSSSSCRRICSFVSIATCIIVLKKSAKKDNNILFWMPATFSRRKATRNRMMPEHLDAVVNAIAERKESEFFTKLVPCDDVAKKDYNPVSVICGEGGFEEEIDIDQECRHQRPMEKVVKPNADINKIIAELKTWQPWVRLTI